MKKIALIVALIAIAGVSFAGQYAQFSATETSGGDLVIEPGPGQIVSRSMVAKFQAGDDLVIDRAVAQTKAYAAVSADTELKIYTLGGSNVVTDSKGGYVTLTTDDELIVVDADGTYQAETISALGNYDTTNRVTTITLDANTTVSANGTVYVVDNDEQQTVAIGTDATTPFEYMFSGYGFYPVILDIPNAGTYQKVSTLIEYIK